MKFRGVHFDKLQALSGQVGVALYVAAMVQGVFLPNATWLEVTLVILGASLLVFFAILKREQDHD